MTSFQFTVSDRDPAVVHEIKNKKVENVGEIFGGLTLEEVEELNRMMTESGRKAMTDQNIRQYAKFLAEFREIEVIA